MRRNADHFPVGVAVLADFANVGPSQHRCDGPDVGRFALNVEVVLISEVIFAAGTHVAGDRRRASREQEHDVFAERIQLAPVAGAETFAQTDQQQQRADSPGDAKHRQEGAQLMRPQGPQHLPQNLEEHHEHGTPPLSVVRNQRLLSSCNNCTIGHQSR